jgi:hypothetical protein
VTALDPTGLEMVRVSYADTKKMLGVAASNRLGRPATVSHIVKDHDVPIEVEMALRYRNMELVPDPDDGMRYTGWVNRVCDFLDPKFIRFKVRAKRPRGKVKPPGHDA